MTRDQLDDVIRRQLATMTRPRTISYHATLEAAVSTILAAADDWAAGRPAAAPGDGQVAASIALDQVLEQHDIWLPAATRRDIAAAVATAVLGETGAERPRS